MYFVRRSNDSQGAGGMSSHGVASVNMNSSSWPGVIGTISIIFAALGIMCWGCNSASSLMNLVVPDMFTRQVEMSGQVDESGTVSAEAETTSDAQGTKTEGNQVEVAMDASEIYSPGMAILDVIMNVVSFGLSIWLLCAGIGLVRRREWSVSSLKAWSWIRILVALTWFFLMFWVLQGPMMEELVRQMQQEGMEQGGSTVDMDPEIMRVVAISVCGLIALLLIAWPVFLLFYLGRQRIRDEVAGWQTEQFPSSEWGGA